jgi:hypothetical protein
MKKNERELVSFALDNLNNNKQCVLCFEYFPFACVELAGNMELRFLKFHRLLLRPNRSETVSRPSVSFSFSF